MGNDGGSIPDRRDLVKSRPKAEQADKANQTRARWFFCALSKRPLQEPIVSCALGKLYNKDAIIEYLLDKSAYGDGEDICGHIRSLKDVKTLKLTPNTAYSRGKADDSTDRAQFICPMNLKEMNGSQPFVFLWTCGCVFSQAGLRAVSGTPPPRDDSGKEAKSKDADTLDLGPQLDICPQCAKKYNRAEDVVLLNPPEEQLDDIIAAMLKRRASEPVKSKGKKRKGAVTALDSVEPPAKKKHVTSGSSAPSINPNMASASRAVTSSLAEEEAKRKANMSEAVKSLYGPKDGVKKKETFMTMGTFTRYA
ncbi:Rtf2 RING-finger-domain-containing protein [Irpex rosettiformis]|uniref:Rtf2 RING-finger-domain-containing protein n=1 Tax=Irpex rosettiformis TaxID=378272 RepID=A0ACB8U6K9_9APHY|nr:Rtf2 RING-finger-domain-containing protein [Irpex rosettiformis]